MATETERALAWQARERARDAWRRQMARRLAGDAAAARALADRVAPKDVSLDYAETPRPEPK